MDAAYWEYWLEAVEKVKKEGPPIFCKNKNMKFNDYHWHDAIIRNILIDRINPGKEDTILFEVIWPEKDETTAVVFEEVYWASLNLNFGIVADESILDAIQLEEPSEDLVQFYSKWKGAINDVKLSIYKIKLNSTGSEIKIIAKTFRVDKM